MQQLNEMKRNLYKRVLSASVQTQQLTIQLNSKQQANIKFLFLHLSVQTAIEKSLRSATKKTC